MRGRFMSLEASHAQKTGRTLYVSEPDQVLGWEAEAMSRYARHREQIRDILEDFRRTGVGYDSGSDGR